LVNGHVNGHLKESEAVENTKLFESHLRKLMVSKKKRKESIEKKKDSIEKSENTDKVFERI